MSVLSGDAVFSEKIGGIQLALFELIWPSFFWIKCIFISHSSNQWCIHVQEEVQSESERSACTRLLQEIFEPLLKNSTTSLTFVFSTSPPDGVAFEEVMSPFIFELIAKEVAPWRLNAGR